MATILSFYNGDTGLVTNCGATDRRRGTGCSRGGLYGKLNVVATVVTILRFSFTFVSCLILHNAVTVNSVQVFVTICVIVVVTTITTCVTCAGAGYGVGWSLVLGGAGATTGKGSIYHYFIVLCVCVVRAWCKFNLGEWTVMSVARPVPGGPPMGVCGVPVPALPSWGLYTPRGPEGGSGGGTTRLLFTFPPAPFALIFTLFVAVFN